MKDVPTEFWKKYAELDMLDREKHIANLVKVIDDLKKVDDDEMRLRCTSSILQGYFDDLIEAIRK